MKVSEAESNKRLAGDFCRLYSEGDWPALARLFADDFRWRQLTSQQRHSPELADLAKASTDTGWSKAETMAIFEQTVDKCVDRRFDLTPVSMTAEQDRVAVEAVGYAVNSANNRVYDNRYHHLFVCRNGLIVELREYQDTLLVYDVWLAP